MALTGRVILNEQEETGNCDFSIPSRYMSKRFLKTFGSEAIQIAFTAVSLIMEAYPYGADYFQTFRYLHPNGKISDFWLIHDHDHFTVSLADEY